MDSVEWTQPPMFEGFEIVSSNATLQAVNIVLTDDLAWGDEVEIRIVAKVTRIAYDLDKDKSGFGDSGQRKHLLTPVDVILVRADKDAG